MPKGLDCEDKGADDETCRSGTLDTPTVLEGLADGTTVVGGGVTISLSELAAIFVPTLVSSIMSELGSSAKKKRVTTVPSTVQRGNAYYYNSPSPTAVSLANPQLDIES